MSPTWNRPETSTDERTEKQYWYNFSAWKTALVQWWVLWIIYANFLYFISHSLSTVCVPDIEIDAIHTKGNLVKITVFRKSTRATIRWHWSIFYTKLMTNLGEILLWLFPKENLCQFIIGNDTSFKVLMSGCESNYVTSFFFFFSCAIYNLVWATLIGWFPATLTGQLHK